MPTFCDCLERFSYCTLQVTVTKRAAQILQWHFNTMKYTVYKYV
jgi:hypothetical protein